MSIITHISGGLGNQMFQYATGFALSRKLGVKHILDSSSFKTDPTNREFMLNKYSISSYIRKPSNWFGEKFNGLLRLKFGVATGHRVYPERNNSYDNKVMQLTDNTYLLGHWQSPKYFVEYRKEILHELKYSEQVSLKTRKLIEEIKNTQESISLHFRRGDYVTNPTAVRVLGALPLEYYNRSIKYISNKTNDPKFYIFSDDLNWVKKNLRIEKYNHTFVKGNSPCEDIELMRECKHHIIANSSFSWWGAWLSNQSGSVNVAPEKWFSDSHYKSIDLVPPEWKRL